MVLAIIPAVTALRTRLEGTLELLEGVAESCEALRRELTGPWRDRLAEGPWQRLLKALVDELGDLPSALAKVAALRDRVARPEQKQLEKIVRAAQRSVTRATERVDAVLVVCAAERPGSLADKVARLAELALPFSLPASEPVLFRSTAQLERMVDGLFGKRSAPLAGARLPGELLLTPRRLLYQAPSGRLEVPLAQATMSYDEERGVVIASGDLTLEGAGTWVNDVGLRLILLRRFPHRVAAPVAWEAATVRRLGDGVDGALLAWPDGVVFAPRWSARELLDALAAEHEPVIDGWTPGIDALEVLEALGPMLPWAGQRALSAVARSPECGAWRRDELVIDDDHLLHRSRDVAQPAYAVGPEVVALLNATT